MNLYYRAKFSAPVVLTDVPVDQAVPTSAVRVEVDDTSVVSATIENHGGTLQLVVTPQPNQVGRTAVVTLTDPLGGTQTLPFTIVGGGVSVDLAGASYTPMGE